MLYQFIKVFYIISTILLFLVISYKIYKEKYLIVTSLVFWMGFFYFCYVAFPCFFIEEINKNWNFTSETLTYSRIIVLIYNLFFVIILSKITLGDKSLKNSITLKKRYKMIYQLLIFIEIISVVLITFSVLKLIIIRQNTSGYRAYFIIRSEAESLEAKYHLRMFLYLLIPASFYLFWKNKKVIFFAPLIGIVLFETLAGKRTTAFIVLLYLYCLYVLVKKKLSLKIIIPLMVVLLVGVLFTRAEALNTSVNAFAVFGEFFETFTTLPYIIEHNMIGSGFDFERILSDYTFASFLPGSIKLNLLSYKSVGSEIAKTIGRGYGLGSLFITEQIYEFGYFGLLTTTIIPFIVIFLDKKLCGSENFLIKIVFIFQLRLYIREGITQFMVIFYILIIYFALFYFFRKDELSLNKTISIKYHKRLHVIKYFCKY